MQKTRIPLFVAYSIIAHSIFIFLVNFYKNISKNSSTALCENGTLTDGLGA